MRLEKRLTKDDQLLILENAGSIDHLHGGRRRARGRRRVVPAEDSDASDVTVRERAPSAPARVGGELECDGRACWSVSRASAGGGRASGHVSRASAGGRQATSHVTQWVDLVAAKDALTAETQAHWMALAKDNSHTYPVFLAFRVGDPFYDAGSASEGDLTDGDVLRLPSEGPSPSFDMPPNTLMPAHLPASPSRGITTGEGVSWQHGR